MAELTLVEYHDIFVNKGGMQEFDFDRVLQNYFSARGTIREYAGIETLIEQEGLLPKEKIRELMACRNTEYAVCAKCGKKFRVFGWSEGLVFPCSGCENGRLELTPHSAGVEFDQHFDAWAYFKRIRDKGKDEDAVVSLDAFLTAGADGQPVPEAVPEPDAPKPAADEIPVDDDDVETKLDVDRRQPVRTPPYIPEEYEDPSYFFDCKRVSICEELGFANTAGRAENEVGIPSDRYAIIDEIGRGATGVVLRVFDRDLNREVALKVIYTELRKKMQDLLRFVEEAQVAAQLEHPNIVPVHDVGLDANDRIYFTMKLVRGKTLAGVIGRMHAGRKDVSFNRAQLLDMFLKICDGVDFAHSRGVIHRDLKPDNVMIGDYGEVYVMDWGLAKIMGGVKSAIVTAKALDVVKSAVEITSAGRVYGTPVYMSPEQANGHMEQLDRRSDVYALGAILYYLLTFKKPIDADGGVVRILERVARGEFLTPRQRAPEQKIPRELEDIVLKAMRRDPDERYPSARAIADDILRFEGKS